MGMRLVQLLKCGACIVVRELKKPILSRISTLISQLENSKCKFPCRSRNLVFFLNFRSTSAVSRLSRMEKLLESQNKMQEHLTHAEQKFVPLDVKSAFESLPLQSQQYVYHLSKASRSGGLIVLLQTSAESPAIFLLLQKLFRGNPMSELRDIATSACLFTQTEFENFLLYAAYFYANMGNYKGFGDQKFIPDVPKEKLRVLVEKSKAFENEPFLLKDLLHHALDKMYSLEAEECQLGLPGAGVTTYFSRNLTSDELSEIPRKASISPYNTRLFKVEKDGKSVYEIKLASALPNVPEEVFTVADKKNIQDVRVRELATSIPGGDVWVVRDDYQRLLPHVLRELVAAHACAANDNERGMLREYILHFATGDIACHKNGSRHWIRDVSPAVESYIGFIETYRDPVGTRAEFEGFVAAVNRERSEKYQKLVANAANLLPSLPWPAFLEKDKFLQPDFTSLDVLCFASSGVPLGINIPNYDDIRQDEGFKNVSLENVIVAKDSLDKVSFLSSSDQDIYQQLKPAAFQIQVALHELLGHGSGKLLHENEDGSFNFDTSVKNPVTGDTVSSWYKPGHSYDSVFGSVGSSYEECRAECVGLYLCDQQEVLTLFGHEGQCTKDLVYVNWLTMARAGVLALEQYSPDIEAWRQAHSQARYVILRVLLEAGEGFVTLTETEGEDSLPDLLVSLDRTKIDSVGKPALASFLRKLQVFKATADIESAKQLYCGLSEVKDSILSYRGIVMMRKKPRNVVVQPNFEKKDNGNIVMREYEEGAENMIQSFVDRYDPTIETDLYEQYKIDRELFAG